jgi:NADH dehydrogenase [ubiquinone] 1 alpha subcomplex assembly factor 7
MTPLARDIAARIARDGPLPVQEFMRLCLSHPEHGYYRTQQAIGAAGDFITAPEISQVFGELIGLWAAEIWASIGRPSKVALAELGPGRGTLMADALRAVAKVAPEFRKALHVHLVDINTALRPQQEAALREATPRWHETLATLPDEPLIVIANEFFDALPIRQLVRTETGWRERVVTLDNGRLGFAAGRPVDWDGDASTGSVVEVSPDGEAHIRAVAQRIARHRGAALIVDYGPFASGIGDTLQAVRRQQKVDPLAEPGLADLTAHVDFARLAAAARAEGVLAYGPVPQGTLLRRLGVAVRAATLIKADAARGHAIEAAIARLIEPDQMGTLFKALALVDAGQPAPPGFDPLS